MSEAVGAAALVLFIAIGVDNVVCAVLAGDLGSVVAPAGENNYWLT